MAMDPGAKVRPSTSHLRFAAIIALCGAIGLAVTPTTAASFQPLKSKESKDARITQLEGQLKSLLADPKSDPAAIVNLKNELSRRLEIDGQFDRAAQLIEEIREEWKKTKTYDDAPFFILTEQLGMNLRQQQKYAQAAAIYEELAEYLEKKKGVGDAKTTGYSEIAANLLAKSGKVDVAVAKYREILKRHVAVNPKDHAAAVRILSAIMMAYENAGKNDEAFRVNEELFQRARDGFGDDHFLTQSYRVRLAEGHHQRQQYAKSLEHFLHLRKSYGKKYGEDHRFTLTTDNRIALAYQNLGQVDKAIPIFDETLAKFRKAKGIAPDELALMIENVAGAYEVAGKLDQGETLRKESVALYGMSSGAKSPAAATAMIWLGMNLLKQKKWSDAETVIRDSVAIRKEKEPNDWRTFSAMSLLGETLLEQKKYADAEPMLIDGHEGMTSRVATIPAPGRVRYLESFDRLIRLYEATNRPDLAAATRKVRDAAKSQSP